MDISPLDSAKHQHWWQKWDIHVPTSMGLQLTDISPPDHLLLGHGNFGGAWESCNSKTTNNELHQFGEISNHIQTQFFNT